MDNDQVKKLLEPFAASEIEYLPKGGRKLAYISHPAVTRRLLEVFGLEWSFEIVETRLEADDVAVLGRLTCGNAVRMQWGGHARRGMDLDDALKSAGSFALKKCASLFGVGLYLWDDAPTEQENARALRTEQAATTTATVTTAQLQELTVLSRALRMPPEQVEQLAQDTYHVGVRALSRDQASSLISQLEDTKKRAGAEPPTAAPADGPPVTEKQLQAIMAIGRHMGWSSEAIRERSIEVTGVPPSQLTRKQASALIDELKERSEAAA